jgi:hypothetical protein
MPKRVVIFLSNHLPILPINSRGAFDLKRVNFLSGCGLVPDGKVGCDDDTRCNKAARYREGGDHDDDIAPGEVLKHQSAKPKPVRQPEPIAIVPIRCKSPQRNQDIEFRDLKEPPHQRLSGIPVERIDRRRSGAQVGDKSIADVS